MKRMIKDCRAIDKPDPKYLERVNIFVVCFKKKDNAMDRRRDESRPYGPRLFSRSNRREHLCLVVDKFYIFKSN